MTDPRAWLDFVFESLIAFPLRTFTFVVGVSWWAGALGGLTYVLWGGFLPEGDVVLSQVLASALSGGALTLAPGLVFLLEAAFRFVMGLILLLTLPWVMHGLARLDAVVTSAALGSAMSPTGATSAAGATSTAGSTGMPVAPTPAGSPAASNIPTAAPSSPTVAGTPSTTPTPTEADPGPFLTLDGWAWLTAGFAAAVLVAVGWPVLTGLYGVPVVYAMVIALAHSASLLLAVRWSLLGLVGNVAAILTTALLTGATPDLPWPWPVTTLLAHSLVVLLLAMRHLWFVPLVAWATGTLAPVAAVLLLRTDGLTGAIDSMIIAGSVSAGVLVVGAVIRQLERNRAALRTERQTTSELSARQDELQERNRIAQELHDVVAHSMSVISVQATTAEYRLPDVDPDTGREFSSIADSSRRALSEMRGLLTVLRGSSDAPLVPQPDLLDIAALVDSTRLSGAHITFQTEPSQLAEGRAETTSDTAVQDVPPAVGLTVYRTVQEALSNAVRHSPGAAIDVRVMLMDDRIALDVTNGNPAEAAPGRPLPVAPGAGLGLAGIRERVGALGGSVEAVPRPDGGFSVRAQLPTR
jgi:signal transduction histidine kinase